MIVKKIALVFFFLTIGWVVEAQGQDVFSNRNWTWISGSNVGGAAGSYGTLRVESSSNTPPSRYRHSMVYHPLTNSIYIMHGLTTGGWRLADVWRFNLTSNRWTWIGGSSTLSILATFGTKGVADSANIPGSRDSSTLITDANGFLYTFGGNGYDTTNSIGCLNDLWRYDLSTNWFTWLTGSNARDQTGTYGTQGVEALANTSGGRASLVAVYHQRTNSIYIYGGYGYSSSGWGCTNDLWRYNITSGMWAWLQGASSSVFSAVFNTINVESATTTPGQSFYSGMTIVPNNDVIYLFGGSRTENALFRYNISSNRWTWIAGSSTGSALSNYGTMNVEASTNATPSKSRMAINYHPASNNLIVYGDNNNDLWRFNLTSNMWAWVQGTNASNVAPIYGTLGVSATTNMPGTREAPAGVIIPDSNTLLIFGGLSLGSNQFRGDLWQYVIDSVTVVVPSTTTSTTTTSTTTTSTTSSSTTISMSVGTGTISTRSTMSLTLATTLSTFSSESLATGATTIVQLVPTSSLTTVAPTSTDSPIAPGSTSSSSLIVYAGAGGGSLLLIGVVVAIVLVRRKSASNRGKQEQFAQAQSNQMISNGVYNTQSYQPPMPFTSMMTTQQSMYPQNPVINTMGRQDMYSQPMYQQNMPMGMGIPMNPNTNMGFPMNTNLNMGMNGNITGMQQSMMQAPVMNSGQGAGTMIVDDYETPRNYNQFQY